MRDNERCNWKAWPCVWVCLCGISFSRWFFFSAPFDQSRQQFTRRKKASLCEPLSVARAAKRTVFYAFKIIKKKKLTTFCICCHGGCFMNEHGNNNSQLLRLLRVQFICMTESWQCLLLYISQAIVTVVIVFRLHYTWFSVFWCGVCLCDVHMNGNSINNTWDSFHSFSLISSAYAKRSWKQWTAAEEERLFCLQKIIGKDATEKNKYGTSTNIMI